MFVRLKKVTVYSDVTSFIPHNIQTRGDISSTLSFSFILNLKVSDLTYSAEVLLNGATVFLFRAFSQSSESNSENGLVYGSMHDIMFLF